MPTSRYFNPDTVIDRSTYENTNQLSTGIEYIFVNGVSVLNAGKVTDAKSGVALRIPQRRYAPAPAKFVPAAESYILPLPRVGIAPQNRTRGSFPAIVCLERVDFPTCLPPCDFRRLETCSHLRLTRSDA